MEEIIKLENIDKTFYSQKDRFFALTKKKIEVLRNLNLKFKKGEIVALLGPNGSGKTTIFKMISTLLYPNSGNLRILGNNPLKDPIPVRKEVSFITSEERSFYFMLTGRQNLHFFASLCNVKKNEREERISKIASLLKLEDHLNIKYQEFSTGLKQKLNLARGLIRESSILLLDEPIKSLDSKTASEVKNYLKYSLVNGKGNTVIFTTHNMNEIEDYADRFLILDEGTIVADFKKDKLKKDSLERLYKTYVA